MAFTYDLTSNSGKVRLLIPDNKAAAYAFEDDEVSALLLLEGDDVKRAAALGLETIASNEVLLLKVIKLLDIQTDGARVADALLKRAAELRKQALVDVTDTSYPGWEIAEWAVDDFSTREMFLGSADV